MRRKAMMSEVFLTLLLFGFISAQNDTDVYHGSRCGSEYCKKGMDCLEINHSKRCVDPCFYYTTLDDPRRSVSNKLNSGTSSLNDRNIRWEGWYRLMLDGISAKIPEICVGERSCGAEIPLWLRSRHPRPDEGVTRVRVCGVSRGSCCRYDSSRIDVKACPGVFYVYKLVSPSKSYSAYCAALSELPPTTTTPEPTTTTTTTPEPTTTTTTTPEPTTTTTTTPEPTTTTTPEPTTTTTPEPTTTTTTTPEPTTTTTPEPTTTTTPEPTTTTTTTPEPTTTTTPEPTTTTTPEPTTTTTTTPEPTTTTTPEPTTTTTPEPTTTTTPEPTTTTTTTPEPTTTTTPEPTTTTTTTPEPTTTTTPEPTTTTTTTPEPTTTTTPEPTTTTTPEPTTTTTTPEPTTTTTTTPEPTTTTTPEPTTTTTPEPTTTTTPEPTKTTTPEPTTNDVIFPPVSSSYLECGRNLIEVGLPLAEMNAAGLDATSAHLSDRLCSTHVERDGKVWYQVDRKDGSCGNILKTNGSHAIYSNNIFVYPSNLASGDLSQPVRIHFTCIYPMYTGSTLDVVVKPYLGMEGKGLVNVGSKAEASMSLFHSADYMEPYPTGSVTLPLGSVLYVGVSVKETETDRFVVVLEDCYATHTPDPYDLTRYFLIQHKCPTDHRQVTMHESGVSLKARFSALLFLFQGDYRDIYLHCSLSLCDQKSSSCSPMCSRRAARSASESVSLKPVTIGPIHLSPKHT